MTKSWPLDNQVLLTPNLTSALRLALHILSHRCRNENVSAKIATAVAFSQVGISSLIGLHSRHGLTTKFNISKSNGFCAAVDSEDVVMSFGACAASS